MTTLGWFAALGTGSIIGLLFILVIHNFRMQTLRQRIVSLETRLDDHMAWLHRPSPTVVKKLRSSESSSKDVKP